MLKYRNVKAHETACISPSAGIIGDVELHAHSSVFAGAQLRADEARIVVGEGSNVQELACIHVSKGHDCIIGKNVTIGHGAIVHGCTIEDDVLIGMGSIVLDGALIKSGTLVAAGALITGGKTFPENSLVMGVPGKEARILTNEQVEAMVKTNGREYLEVSENMVNEGMMFHPGPDFNHQI